jgi:single stranded DNA-binding protein
MKGYSKAMIMGNLTADPESRVIKSQGEDIEKLEFAIAVNSKRGEGEHTSFFRVEAWGKLAEVIKLATKGERVFVEATISQHSYEDDTGKNRSVTRFTAREFRFLGGNKQEA